MLKSLSRITEVQKDGNIIRDGFAFCVLTLLRIEFYLRHKFVLPYEYTYTFWLIQTPLDLTPLNHNYHLNSQIINKNIDYVAFTDEIRGMRMYVK